MANTLQEIQSSAIALELSKNEVQTIENFLHSTGDDSMLEKFRAYCKSEKKEPIDFNFSAKKSLEGDSSLACFLARHKEFSLLEKISKLSKEPIDLNADLKNESSLRPPDLMLKNKYCKNARKPFAVCNNSAMKH